jgi:hypothetical protein
VKEEHHEKEEEEEERSTDLTPGVMWRGTRGREGNCESWKGGMHPSLF